MLYKPGGKIDEKQEERFGFVGDAVHRDYRGRRVDVDDGCAQCSGISGRLRRGRLVYQLS
jgi:hypothetical protein